jgi:RNA polymerase sigma-70 factor (ECF subfamily)
MTHDFTAIYELQNQAIYRYCLTRCRDREVAEDLVQITFLRFWLCLEREDTIINARAFLYRIAHNLIIDFVRKKKLVSLDQLLEAGFEPATDPWHVTHSRLDAEKVFKKLSTMHDSYKDALHRRYLRGLQLSDLAAITGETTNTISVRIFRGLKNLRALLQQAPIGIKPIAVA